LKGQGSTLDGENMLNPLLQRHPVFFLGCNVYFQPEKILNAMDIIDAIGDDYAFLSAVDYY